jgi:hypothetical protein
LFRGRFDEPHLLPEFVQLGKQLGKMIFAPQYAFVLGNLGLLSHRDTLQLNGGILERLYIGDLSIRAATEITSCDSARRLCASYEGLLGGGVGQPHSINLDQA